MGCGARASNGSADRERERWCVGGGRGRYASEETAKHAGRATMLGLSVHLGKGLMDSDESWLCASRRQKWRDPCSH